MVTRADRVMPELLRERRGVSVVDMLLILATLSVAVALVYPAWSGREFRSRVQAAISGVDALGLAARGIRDDTDRWPTPAPLGDVPPELSGVSADAGMFEGTGYAIEWSALEVVDSVEAPPSTDIPSPDDAPQAGARPRMLPVVRSVGVIAVHSSDSALLAELTEHYGRSTSFVMDTTWHLVLPDRAEALPSR